MGVAVPGAGPVDPGEGKPGRAIRILHGEECGEVVLFGVAGFRGEAGEAELVPEAEVTDDDARVAAGEDEELGADAEGGEGDFGEHGGTRGVARVEVGVVGEDLDEAAVGKGGVFEEVVVDEGEGVEGDAVLGEEGEVEVEGVVEECGGDEAAGGGDEGGGGAGGGFWRDEAGAGEGAAGGGDGGVGVDVDVEEVGVGGGEEGFPERGEGEVGVGEEEEGYFGGGGEVGGGVWGGGAAEEGEVVGVGRREEEVRGEEEEEREGEEEG